MAARVTYRRKHSYRTRSNLVRKIRTPGGRLTVQYRTKLVKRLKCAETGKFLNGISMKHSNKVPRKQRTVTRPYGGVYSAKTVENRIKRAFFNEEMKILKNAVHAKKPKSKVNKKK
jgi:large subunit ribosomal protein L34e